MSRAVWFPAARTVELRDEPVQVPKARQVTVQARYSLISPGTEMHVFRGDGGLPDQFLSTMQGTFSFPVKFGYQTVGTVVDVGPGSSLRVGDHVFCRHPHQERFTLPESEAELIPGDVELDRAVLAALFKVAVNCCLDAPVRFGEVVVVTGLGLVGTFCAFLARKAARKLILVDPSENRRSSASWITADAVLAPEDLSGRLAELAAPRSGADVWIETSGNGRALQLAIDNCAEEATVAVPALYGSNEVPLRLSPEFHLRRLRIVSSWVGHVGSGMQPRWDRPRLTETALHYLNELDIDNVITHRMPFSAAPEAYRLIDETPDATLGVLLEHD
jgi:2-desacetyl-2-hydroxyethyl bacteriochlorophyllide A dehydrogenase